VPVGELGCVLVTLLRHCARRSIPPGVRKGAHVRVPLGAGKNSFANGFSLIEVSVARPTAGKDLRLQFDGIAA
jgi:hypothetical protein